ncbi:protein G12 [Drosophila tropicalis]|uniref:protein G12 n=1 Tax=Drosophila tropicalis TaxID=46794 RepID=UPI0035ABFE37
MTLKIYRMLYHVVLLIGCCCISLSAARNLQLHSDEVVMVEDIVKEITQDASGSNSSSSSSSVALITLKESSEESKESEESVTDDLIFLAPKSPLHITQIHHHHQHHHSEEKTMDELNKEETTPVTPIDMSAFMALIPFEEVQTMVKDYYRHDAKVQRAVAFLTSSYFIKMKQEFIQSPEVQSFTSYLNASGLDVLKLINSVIQAAIPPQEELILDPTDPTESSAPKDAKLDEIVNEEDGTPKVKLNNLHGLVKSILDIVPQDQILATFFDKIETDKQFAKLVNSIGTPKFATLLDNLLNSVHLQKLKVVLENNSIYLDKIVDSLKSYFFLSSF